MRDRPRAIVLTVDVLVRQGRRGEGFHRLLVSYRRTHDDFGEDFDSGLCDIGHAFSGSSPKVLFFTRACGNIRADVNRRIIRKVCPDGRGCRVRTPCLVPARPA
jgi:hypothetical protein